MSDLEDGNQEDVVKWTIRYVVIPVSLAVITGLFALEVIGREIASRPVSDSEVVNSVLATLTAVATFNPPNPPTPEIDPSSTPTAVPPATEEANVTEPGETIADNPGPITVILPPTAVCGQVPAGWQPYIVQPGNTLYSLARQTGTTVPLIQQVNCLGATLSAFAQIWLPFAPRVEPVPTEVEPTLTVTAPGLPDLIGYTGSQSALSVTCPDGPGTCTTSLTVVVGNVGSADADLFDIQVWLDPAQSVVLNQVVDRLLPGETISFLLTSPPGGNCYNPDCTVCIMVDTGSSIAEANEDNNQFCATFSG